ncbi:MAG: hypothetical protein RR614_06005, partial [Eubacterium sp.]
EEPHFPDVLKALYAADQAKEEAEKFEQEKIIQEMRQEYAERVKRQEAEAALKASESEGNCE